MKLSLEEIYYIDINMFRIYEYIKINTHLFEVFHYYNKAMAQHKGFQRCNIINSNEYMIAY